MYTNGALGMNSLMKEQVLGDEGLNTLLCEVEVIINGRPITKLSDDPRDLQPLAPNHMLLLRSGPLLLPGNVTSRDNYYNRRWRQVQYLADILWRRWVREKPPVTTVTAEMAQAAEELCSRRHRAGL